MEDDQAAGSGTTADDLTEDEFVTLLTKVHADLDRLVRSNTTLSKATLWDNRWLLAELLRVAEEALAEQD